jgi:TolB-like protein
MINVQLIHTANDNHRWVESYPHTLENIFGDDASFSALLK